eukprot:4401560-Alexandrium_andersonii.AAC.1
MNFELAEARRVPWTGAGWDWSHITGRFVGFDGATLRQMDVLLPDDLVRMWTFAKYFTFAHRASELSAA